MVRCSVAHNALGPFHVDQGDAVEADPARYPEETALPSFGIPFARCALVHSGIFGLKSTPLLLIKLNSMPIQ